LDSRSRALAASSLVVMLMGFLVPMRAIIGDLLQS
jgi:hypothetical protein